VATYGFPFKFREVIQGANYRHVEPFLFIKRATTLHKDCGSH
jgi:hypothetical protein